MVFQFILLIKLVLVLIILLVLFSLDFLLLSIVFIKSLVHFYLYLYLFIFFIDSDFSIMFIDPSSFECLIVLLVTNRTISFCVIRRKMHHLKNTANNLKPSSFIKLRDALMKTMMGNPTSSFSSFREYASTPYGRNHSIYMGKNAHPSGKSFSHINMISNDHVNTKLYLIKDHIRNVYKYLEIHTYSSTTGHVVGVVTLTSHKQIAGQPDGEEIFSQKYDKTKPGPQFCSTLHQESQSSFSNGKQVVLSNYDPRMLEAMRDRHESQVEEQSSSKVMLYLTQNPHITLEKEIKNGVMIEDLPVDTYQ